MPNEIYFLLYPLFSSQSAGEINTVFENGEFLSHSLSVIMRFLGRSRYGLSQALGNTVIIAASKCESKEARLFQWEEEGVRREVSSESGEKQNWILKIVH